MCDPDLSKWPGPDYSPQIFCGAFPIANVYYSHDLYRSINGLWYEYTVILFTTVDEIAGIMRDWTALDQYHLNEDAWEHEMEHHGLDKPF